MSAAASIDGPLLSLLKDVCGKQQNGIYSYGFLTRIYLFLNGTLARQIEIKKHYEKKNISPQIWRKESNNTTAIIILVYALMFSNYTFHKTKGNTLALSGKKHFLKLIINVKAPFPLQHSHSSN